MAGGRITYLVTRRHRETVEPFLEGWGSGIAPRFEIVHYEDLRHVSEIAAGTCIFSDLDRLGPAERAAAVALHRQLGETGAVRTLNDPGESLRRFDLLERLHADGRNRFRAYRASLTRTPPRFPVFLRYENEHWGAISPLLRDQHELDRALARACLLHRHPRDLLIVEFCDTRDADGLYRKYSAFVVGGRVVPRDLIFDTTWLQKDIAVVTPASVAEERRYLDENPHERQLLEVARLAGIGYGRIDYGFLEDEIQVWEINTNPIVCRLPGSYRTEHVANQAAFAAAMREALAELAEAPGAAAPVPVVLPLQSRRPSPELGAGLRRVAWDALSRMGSLRLVRPLVAAVERGVGALHRPLAPLVALRLR